LQKLLAYSTKASSHLALLFSANGVYHAGVLHLDSASSEDENVFPIV
jgi:hypothetical protein